MRVRARATNSGSRATQRKRHADDFPGRRPRAAVVTSAACASSEATNARSPWRSPCARNAQTPGAADHFAKNTGGRFHVRAAGSSRSPRDAGGVRARPFPGNGVALSVNDRSWRPRFEAAPRRPGAGQRAPYVRSVRVRARRWNAGSPRRGSIHAPSGRHRRAHLHLDSCFIAYYGGKLASRDTPEPYAKPTFSCPLLLKTVILTSSENVFKKSNRIIPRKTVSQSGSPHARSLPLGIWKL
jgi:hypothetical protein